MQEFVQDVHWQKMIEPIGRNNEKNRLMLEVLINVVNEKWLDNQRENRKNLMGSMINNRIEIVRNENISLLLNEMLSKNQLSL